MANLLDKFCEENGRWVIVRPPESRIGPLTDDERSQTLSNSPLSGIYDEAVDRQSAYEILKQKAAEAEEKKRAKEEQKASRSTGGKSQRQGIGETFAKQVARTIGSKVGQQLVRGLLGSLLGRKK